ncbi:MAG TPA: hypothetical protein VGC76_02375 [Pyrinomonadaceae bacterium]|jgi:hypothetical protein
MRKLLIGLTGLALCSIFLFGYFFVLPTTSAQKVARLQWEYASIRAVYSLTPPTERLNRIFGVAEICYLQAAGCKSAEVRHELNYGEFLVERGLTETYAARKLAGTSAGEIAFQKALAQLGSDGWEIIGDPNIKFEFFNVDDYNKYENKSLLVTREDTKAVYFKRVKAQ